MDIPQRLLIIHNELAEVIDRHKPTTAAIEAIFAYKSAESAIRLGQACGVALMTLAQKGLSVEAYNPMTVKQSVGGHGKSGKEEIIRITTRLFWVWKNLFLQMLPMLQQLQSLMSSGVPYNQKFMSNLEHDDSNLSSSKRALTPNQQKNY